MSPEQANGERVGIETDIFSLGSVLTFAATGAGPFGTGQAPALLYRIVHSDPNLSGLPSEIRSLVERCLAHDPDLRPTTAELLAELGDVRPAYDWLPQQFNRVFARYRSLDPDLGGASHPSTVAAADAGPAADQATQPAMRSAAPLPVDRFPELAWVATSRQLAIQISDLMKSSGLSYSDLAARGRFKFLSSTARIAEIFDGRVTIPKHYLDELLKECGLTPEERQQWQTAWGRVTAATIISLRVNTFQVGYMLDHAKQIRRDDRRQSRVERARERGSLRTFADQLFRDIQAAEEAVSGEAYQLAQRLQSEVESMGATDSSLRYVQELAEELLGTPVDASDADLRHLNFNKLDPIVGVIWTPRTRWPTAMRRIVREFSREISREVFQVEAPRAKPSRRFFDRLR